MYKGRVRKGCALLVVLASFTLLVQLFAQAETNAPLSPSSNQGRPITLFLNSRESFVYTQGVPSRTYYFTPARNGSYLFCGLPDGDGAALITAALLDEDGETVGESTERGAFTLAAPLEAGVRYALVVASADDKAAVYVEVMEDTFGRCADKPTRLTGETIRYARSVVNARDTHWFSFVAPRDGWYVIRTESMGDAALDTRGYLLDDHLREVAQNDDILFPGDGNFRICARLTADKTYYIRISAGSNQTGSYRLVMSAPEAGAVLPVRMTPSAVSLTLKPGETLPLNLLVQPENSQNDIAYASANRSVAVVSSSGAITGVAPGQTVIHVYAGLLEATCTVTVQPIALTGIALGEENVSLPQAEQTTLKVLFMPNDASNQSVTFESEDESVATVSVEGVVTGVGEGVTVITARAQEGGYTARVIVTVTPQRPVYRALVLGEQNYESGRTRTGGLNTAQGVADMLANQSLDGISYQVRLQMDSTREELLSAINETFADAKENDLSLFYINCHGNYDDVAWLELHDGTRITADQLEQLLREIPGRVAVIIDCCRSGGFLGDSYTADRFVDSVCSAFSSARTDSALAAGKYIVLTSAGGNEDSYRRSFAADNDEDSMATIMARSLCEGAGWDIIGNKVCTLKADTNKNRQVTLQEIGQYTRRRVLYYLEGTGVRQTVRIWPEGDQTVLFGRE